MPQKKTKSYAYDPALLAANAETAWSHLHEVCVQLDVRITRLVSDAVGSGTMAPRFAESRRAELCEAFNDIVQRFLDDRACGGFAFVALYLEAVALAMDPDSRGEKAEFVRLLETRVVQSASSRARRERRRRESSEALENLGCTQEPSAGDLLQVLRDFLGRLTPAQRKSVVGEWIGGASEKAIAARIGVSVGAHRVSLSRAKRLLEAMRDE